jgi:hydrogenase maturation factor
MRLSRPARVLRRRGAIVEVETGGEAGWYSALARPEVRTGDWVLTNTEALLTILTREEAAEMSDAVAELEQASSVNSSGPEEWP